MRCNILQQSLAKYCSFLRNIVLFHFIFILTSKQLGCVVIFSNNHVLASVEALAFICRDVLSKWQWHRIGSRWSPVRTLPVAPLWCDLGFVPNSRGNKAAANLRPLQQPLTESLKVVFLCFAGMLWWVGKENLNSGAILKDFKWPSFNLPRWKLPVGKAFCESALCSRPSMKVAL